jgi:hypothetical protein
MTALILQRLQMQIGSVQQAPGWSATARQFYCPSPIFFFSFPIIKDMGGYPLSAQNSTKMSVCLWMNRGTSYFIAGWRARLSGISKQRAQDGFREKPAASSIQNGRQEAVLDFLPAINFANRFEFHKEIWRMIGFFVIHDAVSTQYS